MSPIIKKIGIRLLAGFWWIAALTSCNTTKFLEVEQFLLTDNDIKFEQSKKIEDKRSLKYELSTLYKQEPNSNFFFIPREWIYFKAQDPDDTTKFDRWKLRVLAEQPAVWDPELTRATEEAMANYLKTQGYHEARVESEDRIRGKKIALTYYVNPGPLYTIDSVSFSSPDPEVHQILQEISPRTALSQGAPLSGQRYEMEKKRITNYLRNNGYASFYPTFVAPLEAYRKEKISNRVDVHLEVRKPFEDSIHQVSYVGDITIFPDYDPTVPPENLIDTLIDGFHFRMVDRQMEVKPQTIINGIYLRPGERFNQDDFDKTNQQLSTFGIYKFIRVKQVQDSVFANKLNFRIELTLNKRMEFGIDLELNYTDRSTNTGNLIGISTSPYLRNRNAFHGAEQMVSDLSAGTEVDISQVDNTSRFFNTVDIGLQTDLFFPKFLDYLGIYRGLYRTQIGKNSRLLDEDFYRLLTEKAASRVSVRYNFLKLLQYYDINSFNATYGFDVQRSNTHRYIFNHLGIDVLLSSSDSLFTAIQASNPFLERSFGSQLFVSLLFRDFTFVWNSRPNRRNESHFLQASFEMAGAEIWAGNAIYNAFALQPDTLQVRFLNSTIDFSQYFLSEFDARYYKQYTTERSLAARINLGIARPFGFTTDVPYVKQFFVGGPNSIRAWPARGLGPGGYEDPLTQDPDNRLLLYQTGDIKLELNLEYRFEIFWRLKGALFLDAGNVWTWRRDDARPGSQFLLSPKTFVDENGLSVVNDAFYRQLAVGSGFGFRFDFTYFVFRVDLGLPLRYPFPFALKGEPPASRAERYFWLHDFRGDNRGFQLKDLNLNLGLGYPF